MPVMDGWEVAQHIRAHHLGDKSPVIIMVTAHGRETLAGRLESASNPLDGFLVKPVTASMLFDAVADATAGDTVAANRRIAALPQGQALAGMHLLVVEDNAMNQQVARELLTYQGAQVEVAGDGRQGIKCVAESQLPFDAVLMDIQMPVMDGYEATRILRQDMGRTNLPIIAMTAHALDSDREACLAAGMNDHVGKPIDINELVTTLRRHCPVPQHKPDAEPPSAPRPTPPSAPTPAHARQGNPIVPDMPNGFDLAVALQRLNGDHEFYAVLARNLRADQGDSVEQARRQLAAGDRSGALRSLHTLKGVAATLGAQALAQQTAEVETRVKGGAQATDSASLFDPLAKALAEAIAILEQVANTFAPPTAMPPAAMPATDPVATANAIVPLLAELEPYLAASNMRALDILAALKQACGGALPTEHAALEAALNRLDFVAALAESRRWRDEMPRMGYGAGAISGDTPDLNAAAAACDEPESKPNS
jgi:CheY-like chemotaxis protein